MVCHLGGEKIKQLLMTQGRCATNGNTCAQDNSSVADDVGYFITSFIGQIIAYPKWQQLCSTTGDFEWGPGMDEKKAFGRELILFASTHYATIFPNIKVTYFSRQFKDAQTEELILSMPHAVYSAEGMFYLPSDSPRRAHSLAVRHIR